MLPVDKPSSDREYRANIQAAAQNRTLILLVSILVERRRRWRNISPSGVAPDANVPSTQVYVRTRERERESSCALPLLRYMYDLFPVTSPSLRFFYRYGAHVPIIYADM